MASNGRYGNHCYLGRSSLCGLESLPADRQADSAMPGRSGGIEKCAYCKAMLRMRSCATDASKRKIVERESERQKEEYGLTVQDMLYRRLTADSGQVTVSEMAALATKALGVPGETAVAMMISDGMATVRGDVLVPAAVPAKWRSAK